MLYLALHTVVLLAIASGAFFALGYFYHRRFHRALVVVSEQPPAHPPAPHHQTDAASDQMIEDLRTRLVEKERDLAELLESIPQDVAVVDTERFEKRQRELEGKLAELQMSYNQEVLRNEEIESQTRAAGILRIAEIEGLKVEVERLQGELTQALNAPTAEPVIVKVSDEAEMRRLKARIETLETQLNERDYLLQLTQQKQEQEIRDLETAAEAIWEEDEITFEEVVDDAPVAPVVSTPALSEQMGLQLMQIQTRSESMEKEFRDRIRTLESSLENLRSENEMALLTALEISKTKEADAMPTALWKEAPVAANPERDQMVEALWKQEKDHEKEKLKTSVERLRRELEAKERAIGELGEQVVDLSLKIDPSLRGADNLELIKGIGPATRKMLKAEFAIETFEQVARLTEKDVARISERLFFHGKIEKEDWIGQALALYNKKYGKPIELTDPPYPLTWVG